MKNLKKGRNWQHLREIGRMRSSKKREHNIGENTCFRDKYGNDIHAGDIVCLDGSSAEYGSQIVLFNANRNAYCIVRDCRYGDKNPLDPKCYAVIDFTFHGKPHKLDKVSVIKRQATE